MDRLPTLVSPGTGLCRRYFLSYGLRTVNAVIAPELMRDLGIGASGLGLLTSAYFLGLACSRFRWACCWIAGAAPGRSGTVAGGGIGCTVFALGRDLQTLAVGVPSSAWACRPADGQLQGVQPVVSRLSACPRSRPPSWLRAGWAPCPPVITVAAAFAVLGWRGVFASVAVLLVGAAARLMTTPEHARIGASESLLQQLRSLGIYGNRVFGALHRRRPWSWWVHGLAGGCGPCHGSWRSTMPNAPWRPRYWPWPSPS